MNRRIARFIGPESEVCHPMVEKDGAYRSIEQTKHGKVEHFTLVTVTE